MPNWAANQLTVTGSASSLDEFSQAAAGTTTDGEATPLSLEALLPTPAHLLENAGPTADGSCDLVVSADGSVDLPEDDCIDWRSEHWGVKWELCEPAELKVEPGKLTFWFQSAWTGPTALIAAVAERFADLSFELVCADVSMSHVTVAAFEQGEATHLEYAYMEQAAALDILNRFWPEEAEEWLEDIEADSLEAGVG